MSLNDVTHPDDRDDAEARFAAIESGPLNGYQLDRRLVGADGRVVHVAVSFNCVRQPDGRIDHFVVLFQDITDRKIAEQAIFHREQQFKALAENSPDVIARFDRSHNHVYVNPAVKQFANLRDDQFLGRTQREAGLPETICTAFSAALEDVFRTGRERAVEFQLDARHFHGRIVPEFNASHEVEFALSVTRDVTLIRNQEAQLATAQQLARIGSWERDLKTGRRTWSAEMFRMMGLEPGEPPSESWMLERINEDDLPHAKRIVAAAMSGFSGRQSIEFRMRIVDGRERVFSMLLQPEADPAGNARRVTGTIQDVTELRQAEGALRESEQRLRALIESASDLIVTLDLDGRVLEVNPAVARLMGEPASDLLGRSITDSIHPDHVERVANGLAHVVSSGRIASIEAPLRIASGDYVDIEATATRVSTGHANAIFVIGRDITERKRADLERQKLSRQIELLLESTYEGICSADAEGRCTLANPAAATMLGYELKELTGKNLHELIHDRRSDGSPYASCDCPISRVAETGRAARLNEVFWRKNGTSFPVEIFASPIFDEERRVTGVVASFIDISEREFVKSELERANRLTGLGRVAATMSHEFNNVLMGIQPFADILSRSSDPKVTGAVARITQSVRRGRRVTEEIRRFTKPAEPVRAVLDVRSWLGDAIEEFRRLVPSNIHLSLSAASMLMNVKADKDQITQVLSNAVINARDAIGTSAGTITIAARLTAPQEQMSFGRLPGESPFIEISIVDDGPGIAPENLSRIVEPFFTTKKNGTGLGLAIAQQIVTLHGGYLVVDSALGRGTRVRIFLPSATAAAAPAPAPRPSRSDADIVRDAVIIEDEEAVADGLRLLLEGENVHIRVAGTGAEAMKIIEQNPPQVLIVDISLPDCNGFDLYRRISERVGPIPAVFSSGHADAASLDQFEGSVPIRMLTKPYEVDSLIAALREVCSAAAQT